MTQRRKKLPAPEEVVAAIVALADDGYCRRGELAQRFPRLGERDLRRAVRRAAAQGLVLEPARARWRLARHRQQRGLEPAPQRVAGGR